MKSFTADMKVKQKLCKIEIWAIEYQTGKWTQLNIDDTVESTYEILNPFVEFVLPLDYR